MLKKKNILNVGITDASKEEILEYIAKGLAKNGKKYFIVTPNPEILVMAHKNIDYQKVLNKAEIALADGIGVIIAGQILGKPLKERVTGVDLLESLCLLVSEKPITVGFLGGKPGVAERTAECLRQKYPGLKVVFARSEWPNEQLTLKSPSQFDDSSTSSLGKSSNLARVSPFQAPSLEDRFKNSSHDQAPRAAIHNSQFPSASLRASIIPSIDILFVAFGAPKQELWMNENLDKLPVKVAVGVGGSFDYISGEIPRAPLLIRLIGFEWLFRLIVQPWRIKRQLSLLEFIYLVLKDRLLNS